MCVATVFRRDDELFGDRLLLEPLGKELENLPLAPSKNASWASAVPGGGRANEPPDTL